MSWWTELVAKLASPGWLANVLATFVGAAIAFVGAILLIRIQLRSDRRLAQEQIAAMAADRTAERRADASTELGLVMIGHSNTFDDVLPKDYADLLREWDEEDGPGIRELYEALLRSEAVLDLDSTAWDLWRDWTITWDASMAAVLADRPKDAKTPDDGDFYLACIEEFEPVHVGMAKFGRALVRWDGVGDAPSRGVFGDAWQPIVIDNSTEDGRREAHVARRRASIEEALAHATDAQLTIKPRKTQLKPVNDR